MIYSIFMCYSDVISLFFNLEGLFVLFKRFLPVLDIKEPSLSCKCRLISFEGAESFSIRDLLYHPVNQILARLKVMVE